MGWQGGGGGGKELQPVPQPAGGKSERARVEHPCLVLVAACSARAAHALDHAKSANSLL